MSLGNGKGWIIPTRRAEMASNLGKAFHIKDGKVTKKPARMAAHLRKRLEGKAARATKAWKAKSK